MNRRGFLKFLGAAGVVATSPAAALKALEKVEINNSEREAIIDGFKYSKVYRAEYLADLHSYTWQDGKGFFHYSFLMETDIHPKAKEAILQSYREAAFDSYKKRYLDAS